MELLVLREERVLFAQRELQEGEVDLVLDLLLVQMGLLKMEEMEVPMEVEEELVVLTFK